jgi:radical SAM protein with 4Fe4S-binding SPASM domain
MITTLYTNCTLLTPSLSNFLYENNVTVIGKQNSLSATKQDKLSNKKGAYQNIKKGLQLLINAGFTETKPSRLGIHTVILKENINDIPKMWIQWRKKNILPQVQHLVYPSKKQPRKYFDYYKSHSVSAHETKNLFKKLSEIDNDLFDIQWDPTMVYPIAPDSCRVIYGTLGITQDGDIQICSFTEKSLGNIRTNTLKEINQTEPVKKIRSIHKHLSYPDFSYGCRANAYNMTDDNLAPDPFYDEYLEET